LQWSSCKTTFVAALRLPTARKRAAVVAVRRVLALMTTVLWQNAYLMSILKYS
jgi:hypothetical protein